MRALLIKRVVVTSKKDGRVWVIATGLDAQGNVIDGLIGEKGTVVGNMLEKCPVLDQETYDSLFMENPQVEITYGQRSRIESIQQA